MPMPQILNQVTGWVPLVTALAGILLVCILWNFATRQHHTASSSHPETSDPIVVSALGNALSESIPDLVFFKQHAQYTASLKSYWSKQQREILPECIVKPHNEEDISTTIRIIKREYDRCVREGEPIPTFAVRSGGHSTVPGASNAAGGIVIDLGLLNEVVPAGDRETVDICCGARWGEVSRKLDGMGLAVAGGRNSDVGVGGLTLGGGYSYFSPQCGFVCDNVVEYRVVLASGDVVNASETENPRLWRALKGGGSNFGIVARFKIRAFPCAKVWSGFLYMLSWKAPEILRAFHDFNNGTFDPKAGGPLLCMSYVQAIGLHIIATHLMYTKPEPWPTCWKDFKSIGRVWSSTKIRTLTSTTDELDGISPAGFRQLHISTTVKNDLATLEFCHKTYGEKAKLIHNVRGMVWTLVLQPLHSSTISHGQHNILGLSHRERPENLIVVLFTAVWERTSDDELVNTLGNAAINEIDKYATKLGTFDEFRYLNWCDGVQKPFQGYGENNLRFLRETSQTVDPDGLFQHSCLGGFKLT